MCGLARSSDRHVQRNVSAGFDSVSFSPVFCHLWHRLMWSMQHTSVPMNIGFYVFHCNHFRRYHNPFGSEAIEIHIIDTHTLKFQTVYQKNVQRVTNRSHGTCVCVGVGLFVCVHVQTHKCINDDLPFRWAHEQETKLNWWNKCARAKSKYK